MEDFRKLECKLAEHSGSEHLILHSGKNRFQIPLEMSVTKGSCQDLSMQGLSDKLRGISASRAAGNDSRSDPREEDARAALPPPDAGSFSLHLDK